LTEVKPKQCWVKFDPPRALVGFEIKTEELEDFKKYVGKDISDYTLTLKKKKHKSRNMHNYMWVLCDKIAQARHDFMVYTKDDIYKHAVREVGLWNDIKVPNDSTKDLIADWQRNGTGWFAEVVFRGSEETTLRLYRGASVYSAEDLYRLTNYVVDMAKENGVDTISDAELERLKELW
jgi:hypothetical protein